MAKITLADGMTIEGTAEELRELAKAFGEVAEATEEAQAPDETPETVSTGNVGDIIKITKVGKATVLPTGEYEIIGFDREYYVVYNNGEKEHVKRDADESSYTYEIIPKWAEESEEATESPREGGYVVFEKNGYDITAGKPYKVTEVEFIDDSFAIIDDAEDERWFDSDGEESPCKFYRPIVGAPQVGDKILIVEPYLAKGYYEEGDVLTVAKVINRSLVGVDLPDNPYLLTEEFVIVERAGEEATEVEVGSIVKATKDVTNVGGKCYVGWSRSGQGLIKIGSIGEVVGFTEEGVYAKFNRSAGIDTGVVVHRFFLANGEFEVIEKTPELPDPELFEEGDVVRVTGRTYYGDFTEGTIATVFEVDEEETGIKRIIIETHDDIDRTSADNLVLVAKKSDRKDV